MNGWTQSHTDVILPMMNLESALHAFQSPSFNMERNDTYEDLLISTWEAALGHNSEPLSGKAAVAGNEKAPGGQDSCQIESASANKEDVIAREVKFTVKDLTPTELDIMVESVENILRTLLHPMQRSIRSIIYFIVEQVMMGLFPRGVIGDTLDAQIAQYFMTDALTEGRPKKLLAFSSFMKPTATLVLIRTDTTMDEKMYSLALASKGAVEHSKDVLRL